MRSRFKSSLLALFFSVSCVAAGAPRNVYFLRFPASDVRALGQIDRLVASVSCSWFSGLRNVPELYDLTMDYDMPIRNEFEARPRLGTAAVELSLWNGVIGVEIPADADRKSCFHVKVTAEGRTGVQREWTGPQLGVPEQASKPQEMK